MKTKIVPGIFIIFLSINCLHGQTISYTYDGSGNRLSRITAEQLKSGSVQFPVVNSKKLPVESMKENPIEGELAAYVYPNPNKGLLKIDIKYLPLNSKTEARIYDLNGNEKLVQRNLDSYAEIDISNLKDGIYILRIKINDSVFDWKVVKNH